MVELTPEVRNIIRKQIESKIEAYQQQERAIEFQNEVKKVEQEIWAQKSFHPSLPRQMAITDDKMPRMDAAHKPSNVFLPSQVFNRQLPSDSAFFSGKDKYFSELIWGASARKKRK